jgi:uroporphyrinogen decarboxylase
LIGFEGVYRGWNITRVNFGFSQCQEMQKLSEDEESTVYRRTEGTVLRVQKTTDYHTQTLEWPVKTRADWERVRDRHLQADDPCRFPADWSQRVEEYRTRDYPLQLTHGGVYGFTRKLMGDVNLAYAFHDDPVLVREIMEHYTSMMLRIWDRMTREVEFDLIEFWEDMASKNGSLISPMTFRKFLTPQYRRVAEFARGHGIDILLVDSDGFMEELSGWMTEAGATAVYPFEVGAGNDLARVRERYPNLGMIGGLEKNAMALGPKAVAKEMEKARAMIRRGRFIPGPDHFALSNVSFEQYRYFMEQLKDVVMTTRPGAES